MRWGESDMLDHDTVQQLQNAPIADRIQAIEVLLQSLKHDITQPASLNKTGKAFKIRTFNLGRDLTVDRQEIYAERVTG
jgi:hypothetical protein